MHRALATLWHMVDTDEIFVEWVNTCLNGGFDKQFLFWPQLSEILNVPSINCFELFDITRWQWFHFVILMFPVLSSWIYLPLKKGLSGRHTRTGMIAAVQPHSYNTICLRLFHDGKHFRLLQRKHNKNKQNLTWRRLWISLLHKLNPAVN